MGAGPPFWEEGWPSIPISFYGSTSPATGLRLYSPGGVSPNTGGQAASYLFSPLVPGPLWDKPPGDRGWLHGPAKPADVGSLRPVENKGEVKNNRGGRGGGRNTAQTGKILGPLTGGYNKPLGLPRER
uniref:Uncharacterized protein n=1 Tax=Knipowitschia caucasica TaxID=637954 RepID=A0AAV2KPV2_KNICA